MSISWRNIAAYAFPPVPMLAKVLAKVRRDHLDLILIAQYWPKRTWFPDLLQLAREDPMQLAVGPTGLRPISGIVHGNPGTLLTSCLEDVKGKLTRRGLSDRAVQLVTHVHRKSTRLVLSQIGSIGYFGAGNCMLMLFIRQLPIWQATSRCCRIRVGLGLLRL